ncbi:MAG: hypothetical protein RBT11_14260 [Desulfobacterales bacterium]|jgi:hypothetical protein|nr:hypothetical protein [Desulfobacterales bacterium]
MSNYHILSQSDDKKTINVVFHYVVPAAAKNAANILYTDIVKKCCDLTSQIPNHQIDFAQEYQDMQDGKVIERLLNIRFSSLSLTPAQKKAEIEAAFTPSMNAEFTRLATEWEWYGYYGNVA